MSGNVLLVHDDIAAIAATRRVLVSEGLEVTLATSSADAIIAFGQRPPALVVLAPSVDGGRGASVYQEIRSLPHGEHVRFVLLGANLPDARETTVVALPVNADELRAALHRALATEGAGWELSHPSISLPPQQDTEPPTPAAESPDPWRVADPRTAVSGSEEPLAEALFGDLRPEPNDARVPSAAVPVTLQGPATPEERAQQTTDPSQSDVPAELAQLPLSEEPDERRARPPTDVDNLPSRGNTAPTPAPDDQPVPPAGIDREARTHDDFPTLDKAFEELELPPEEIEAATRARERSEERARARDAAQVSRDQVRSQLEQLRAQRAQFNADAERAEGRRAALEAETQELTARLQAETEEKQAAENRALEQSRAIDALERALASAAGRLAAERQAREASERQLQSAAARHAQLAENLQGAEAEARDEAARRAELEALREKAEEDASREAEATSAASEQAEALGKELAELEQKLQRAQAEAQLQAAARARASQRVDALANEILELEHTAQEAQSRAEAEAAQISGLEARVEELTHEQAEQELHRSEAEKRAKELQARRAQLQAQAQAAQQKAQVESERLTTLQRASEAAEIKLAQAVRAAEKMQAESEQATQKREQAQKALDDLRIQLAERESAQGPVEKDLTQRQKELEKLEKQLERGRAQLAEREQATAQATSARAEADKQFSALARELAALKANLAEAGGALTQAQAAQREHSERADAAAEQLAGARASLKQTEAERDEALAQADAARRAGEAVQQELKALSARLRMVAKEKQEAAARMQETLTALETDRADAKAEVDRLEAEAEAASKVLEALESKKSALDAELAEVRVAREAAEARARALAEKREEFQKAVSAAEGELSASPRQPMVHPTQMELQAHRPATEPALRPPGPPARKLRPFVGGRFKRPEVRTSPNQPELHELDPVAPALPEAPAEPRPPPFEPQGELADMGAAEFLARVWRERVTGRFDFELRDGARALFFEEGRLVAALSSAPYDRLEALAQREGLITRAHEKVLRQESAQVAPRQLAVRLVELQLIKGTELYGLVRRHMEQVAYALFVEERGRYTYSTELAPADLRVALPLHPLAFMLEGVRRKGDFDRLNALLGGPSALVRLREGGPELSELGLTARERRFVSLVDGLRTIEELIFASGLEPPAAVKLLHALKVANAVEVLPGETAAGEDGPELQIDLGRVHEKYEQVKNGDYFEILGVEREATSYEVRTAFERLAREFHPARFAGVAEPHLPGQLEEIARMVAEAADVLADDHTRRAYAQHLAQAS
ncbi:MAG: DnaJ domain-containing protein [Deltaproteobacteria bacterium]|nr:DnaJ domain-containing protein [Deltaproteobacteria bacterium]